VPLKTFGMVAVPVAVTVVPDKVPAAVTVSVVLVVAACASAAAEIANVQNLMIAFIWSVFSWWTKVGS